MVGPSYVPRQIRAGISASINTPEHSGNGPGHAPRGATSRGLLTMEWIVPVIVETRNVHQDILADRQTIAQAQAASQTLHEQLIALAHSAEMGIHQLQQELHLASAIKSMLE